MYIRRVGKRYTLKVVPDIYKYYCVYSHTLYIYIYMYFFFRFRKTERRGWMGFAPAASSPSAFPTRTATTRTLHLPSLTSTTSTGGGGVTARESDEGGKKKPSWY